MRNAHAPATTYCQEHQVLEGVARVTRAASFTVYEGNRKTDRVGTEVHAVTDTGCRVLFIGGPRWNQ